MVSTQKSKVTWTYDDLCQMPDDNLRYEILDGELVMTPSLLTSHQLVSKRIEVELVLQLERKGLGIIFHAPTDVILGDTRVLVPDILVVRTARKNIIVPRGIAGAPDLVVEILSESTSRRDRGVKAKLYSEAGVAESWIVDPEANAIEIYGLEGNTYVLDARFGPGERVQSNSFPIELDIDSIFAPL